jgi:uncharacterized integral membrane protein
VVQLVFAKHPVLLLPRRHRRGQLALLKVAPCAHHYRRHVYARCLALIVSEECQLVKQTASSISTAQLAARLKGKLVRASPYRNAFNCLLLGNALLTLKQNLCLLPHCCFCCCFCCLQCLFKKFPCLLTGGTKSILQRSVGKINPQSSRALLL